MPPSAPAIAGGCPPFSLTFMMLCDAPDDERNLRVEALGQMPRKFFAWVLNARHVKAVPGRKTNVLDAQWLASLARAGLVRASFIAKADLRSLHHIARQRQKLGGMLASEKDRLHKLLTDAGVHLGVVVSDLHGQSARAMVKALIAGKSVPDVLSLASKRLRASREDIFEAVQSEEITPAHCFCRRTTRS